MENTRRRIRDIDFSMISVLVIFAIYSCVAVLAATYGKISIDIPAHAWMKQAMFELVGVVGMVLMASIDYRTLRRLKWWIYCFSILSLLVVFAMPGSHGAHSWIPLKVFSLQPSEFAKLSLILSIAAYMADIDEAEFPDYRLRKTIPIWILFIIPFALTYKEPALGQALVMFAIVMTMLSIFIKRSHFVVLTTTFVAICLGTTLVLVQFPTQAFTFIQKVLIPHHILKGYQADRILSWLDPKYQLSNAGFNVHETEYAIGSGRMFGEGLLNGHATSGGWVPNQWTDYIFSAIGEEFGFMASSILILLFMILIYRLIRIAGTSPDTFGTYVIIGIIGMFGFQIFENIGADMYMSPSTGITLPFISYGGSSLLANFMAIGIAISISMRRKKLRFN